MWLFPGLSYAVIGAVLGVLALLAFMPDQRSTLLLSGASVAIVFVALAATRRRY